MQPKIKIFKASRIILIRSTYSGNVTVRRESSSLISKSAVEPSLNLNDKPPSITRQASNILDFTSIL